MKVVLVVDDDILNRITLNHMLGKNGYEVRLACNGSEALEILATEPIPDAILTDIEMPVMDGRALLHAFRQDERWQNSKIPVIALTAHSLPQDREALLLAGFDALLGKPVEREVLMSTLQSFWPSQSEGTE